MPLHLSILCLVALLSVGLCFRFPLQTARLWHRKSLINPSDKMATSWKHAVTSSKMGLSAIGAGTNDGISGLSSEQKLSSKGFGSGAKKDGRKEAAKQRSARKLAAERGPDYVEPSPMEEFQRLMATLESTASTGKPGKARAKVAGQVNPRDSDLEVLEDGIGPLVEGVEGSIGGAGKKQSKRAKKIAAVEIPIGGYVKREEKDEDADDVRVGKGIYHVETPGERSEFQDVDVVQQPVGRNLRRSPTWRVPTDDDPAGKALAVRTRERMNKVQHIGFEGTPTASPGGGGYEEEEEDGEVDPLQQEPGIYMKDNFGPYVDPGERWDEKDEEGVTIKDPIELRNRRRNRPAAADSTHPNGLYEGGNILMKQAPDVDPSELQDLDPFQRSVWYSGGRPTDETNRNSFWGRRTFNQSQDSQEVEWDPFDDRNHEEEGYAEPQEVRAIINAVITNSSTNCTALEVVRKVYDFIKNGTDNDPRIGYQINCYCVDDEAYPGMENLIQMWLESYNTYHLIDGLAMREAWGCIMPHIVLGQKNLEAILEQVKFALAEDAGDGALLSPRFRTIRLQGGGKQEMDMGYNNQRLATKFSVVNTN